MEAFSKARPFGFRPIGYAGLSGRLPEGVGQEAFWGARHTASEWMPSFSSTIRLPKGSLLGSSAKPSGSSGSAPGWEPFQKLDKVERSDRSVF
ncbi:MAG: hypothetical protein C0407_16860 [Desulfobacca sp.]|nr:hypothetical protein [Desulfobacca sp.]